MIDKLRPLWLALTIGGRIKTDGIGNEYKQNHENRYTNCL